MYKIGGWEADWEGEKNLIRTIVYEHTYKIGWKMN